jgi:hypothetical protein
VAEAATQAAKAETQRHGGSETGAGPTGSGQTATGQTATGQTGSGGTTATGGTPSTEAERHGLGRTSSRIPGG